MAAATPARAAAWASAESCFRLGRDFEQPDRLPPNHQPIDLNRLNRIALAAWPKLAARFNIGQGINLDLISGAWTDTHTGKIGRGVVALVAHIARSTVREAAMVLMRVIKVRRRKQPTTKATADEIAPAGHTVNDAPAAIVESPLQTEQKPSSVWAPTWLRRLFPVIGRITPATLWAPPDSKRNGPHLAVGEAM